MRVVVQRVTEAAVVVADDTIGAINQGFLVFVGIAPGDTAADADWLINKMLNLKLFEDEEGKLKRSVTDIAGELLVISQFTLYADVRKGTSPSWSKAASPDEAEPKYNAFVEAIKQATELSVAVGAFGANMQVSLVNDGPVTVIIDSPSRQ